MSKEKEMEADVLTPEPTEQPTEDPRVKLQEEITIEFKKLIEDLKLNEYGAVAVEVFVNKILQMVTK